MCATAPYRLQCLASPMVPFLLSRLIVYRLRDLRELFEDLERSARLLADFIPLHDFSIVATNEGGTLSLGVCGSIACISYGRSFGQSLCARTPPTDFSATSTREQHPLFYSDDAFTWSEDGAQHEIF